MIKRLPSRNPRSKGIKLKHVLQICLLLGVCFWLIYQVKHSHDKKKEFDEKDAKASVRAQSDDEIPKLGRKDLPKTEKHEDDEEEETGVDEEVNKEEETKHEHEHEQEQGGGTKHEEEETEDGSKHEEEETEEGTKHEEEETEEGTKHEEQETEEGTKHEEEEREEEGPKHEEEESKHEEEEQEEEIKHAEDEGRGDGDDEIDEHEQEKIGEADPEEDFVDEEKEREEEGEDKENEGNEGEDNEAQADDETPSENQDQEGGDQNVHEAREEHYKADDASSAVTHDTQIISTDPEKMSSDNLNENPAMNDLEQENNSKGNKTMGISGDQNNSTFQTEEGMAENGPLLNVTSSGKKDDESILSNSEDNKSIWSNSKDKLHINTTLTSLSNDQQEPSNKSTEVSTEAGNNPIDGRAEIVDSSQHNETVTVSGASQAQNAAVDGATSEEVTNIQTTEPEQANSSMISDNELPDSNSTILGQTENANTMGRSSSNSSRNSQSDVPDRTIKPELTAEAEITSGLSSTTKETLDAAHNENSDTNNESGGTDESLSLPTTDGTENPVVHDPIDSSDSSISQEEKEARIDLSTLPETDNDGVNSKNAAAE